MDALTIPSKRDVKGLTATIGALSSNDSVRAVFQGARYGIVSIEGRAAFSKTTNSYMVAGRAVDANLKPEKSLQRLEVVDPVAMTDPAAEATQGADSAQGAEPAQAADAGETPTAIVSSLQHGDLVTARFFELAYGAFSITGVCVAAPGNSLMLGSWFVARNGVAAPRLNAIGLVARHGEHGVRVPNPIAAWGDEQAAEAL